MLSRFISGLIWQGCIPSLYVPPLLSSFPSLLTWIFPPGTGSWPWVDARQRSRREIWDGGEKGELRRDTWDGDKKKLELARPCLSLPMQSVATSCSGVPLWFIHLSCLARWCKLQLSIHLLLAGSHSCLCSPASNRITSRRSIRPKRFPSTSKTRTQSFVPLTSVFLLSGTVRHRPSHSFNYLFFISDHRQIWKPIQDELGSQFEPLHISITTWVTWIPSGHSFDNHIFLAFCWGLLMDSWLGTGCHSTCQTFTLAKSFKSLKTFGSITPACLLEYVMC